MSYWVYIIDENNQQMWAGNITSNVGAMYELVLAPYLPDRDDYGIRILDGMPCVGASHFLEYSIGLMMIYQDKCRELEPLNGWGTYEAALDFLYQIWQACRNRSNARIHISC